MYLYILIYEAKHVLKQYLILLVWFCFMSFHKYIAMFYLIFKSTERSKTSWTDENIITSEH